MTDQDDTTNFRNPQSPPPNQNTPQDDTFDEQLNTQQSVPHEDVDVVPNPSLKGYQDDFATGDKEDIVQEEQGDSPSDVTGMPVEAVKEEFDKITFDEQEGSSQDEYPASDDMREHIEDMDEADKDR